jgi:hypothetical protein
MVSRQVFGDGAAYQFGYRRSSLLPKRLEHHPLIGADVQIHPTLR